MTRETAEPREPSLRRLILASLAVAVLGFGGLLGWAAAAQLESAVTASGSLVAKGKRKTVSLLDSGLLREVLVRDGDRVEAGQTLLRLDDTQARAAAGQAWARDMGLSIRAQRLRAELAEAKAFAVPDGIDASMEPAVTLIESERALFVARRQTFEGTLAVLRHRATQLAESQRALEVQATATATRLGLLREELGGLRELQAKGFAPRNRVLEMRRQEAALEADLGELAGKKADVLQSMAQAELEIASQRTTWRSDIARELQETVARSAEAAELRRSAEDLLRRMIVRAPEAGVVVDLRFFTPGSSIGAGQPVLDLVPIGNEVLVEAGVGPGDVERIAVGARVNVRLTAYSFRRAPPVSGHLVYVGADRQVNARGEPFFLVLVELDPAAAQGVALLPGMPADVLILGQARSALDFLASPLLDGMRRALRED